MAKEFTFNGTDKIETAVTHAASTLTDEFFKQNGMSDIAENHDDTWYDVQEELRIVILTNAKDTLLQVFKNKC